uniref:Uncharacterized protein n=1 Tax=Onchocerca volvulus TaxID=6282 RepID=A0A8R1TQJ3_ONCVO
MIEKERKVNDLEQIISDLELKLNEHKQSSDVTQARVKDLEIMLDDERNKAQSLANLNAELNTKIENFSLAQQSDIENDRLKLSREELDKKNYEIDNLNMQINDLKWSLGEHKQWLKDANDRANHFENMCKEKDYIIDDLTNRLHGAERRIVEIPIPKNTENLNSLIDDLRNQIDKKNNYIDQLEKTKNEAQWHLGEHQHWLQDANNRIDVLENEKSEVWRKVRELEERLHQVEPVAAAVDYKLKIFSQTKAKMEELQQTMKNKNREYEKLNEQKNEMDVNLGEHKVWLEDAKKRYYLTIYASDLFTKEEYLLSRLLNVDYLIKYLEDEGTENDHFILDINKELGELKEVRIDAFQQLHEKIDDLEFCLSKKINESEFGNDNLEYNSQVGKLLSTEISRQLKRSVKDLGRNISDENIDLNNLSKLKNNGECNFEEQWLQDLKNRITELESAIQRLTNEKNAAISKLNEIEQLETNMEEINKRMLEKDQLIVQLEKKVNDKQNELNSFGWRIEELLRELNEANKNLKNCEQQKNDTEWSLGEHRQWLTDAKNKIDEIENKLEKISGENNKLREEIEELNRASVEATEGLQKEINDKNEQLNCITKQKNDAEWSFGEHRQWLKDANNRISELESALTEKNRFIEEMQNELSSLVDHLQNELSNKNECIKNLEKQCNDAEWSLGEHRQWIHDSSNRIQDLEEELHKNGDCIKQLEREIGNQSAEISNYLATIDALNNELTGKNVCIGDFEKAKNNAEWSLGEHRQWLQNANNRIAQLEKSLITKDEIIKELRNEIDELSKKVVLDLKAALEAVQMQVQPEKAEVSVEQLMFKLQNAEQALAEYSKLDDSVSLKTENENLKELLKEKNEYIDNLVQQRNNAEWSLGEHRQWLQDCNKRANWLDDIVMIKNNEIDELRCENDRLKFDLNKVSQHGDINNLIATIENLHNEISNKNNVIDEIMKQRNEAEWKLGEHRQWLEDAKNRADQLAGKLIEKEQFLNLLLEKYPEIMKEGQNKINVALVRSEPVESDKNKLFEKIFELEEKLLETEIPAKSYEESIEHEATIAKLRDDLDQKDDDLARVHKERSDAEWFLGEERQRLKDANHRIAVLEEELMHEKTKHADMLQSLKNEVFELSEKDLRKVIENLNNELHQCKAENKNLMKQKNNAEWQLGEHREWLRNANNRITVLEEELMRMEEAEKRAHEVLRLENEALNQTNTQLKEDMKHLQDEIQGLLLDAKEKFEEHICCACNEVSAVNRTGNSGEDLSAMSRLLENLLGELNHQKIIDNLMEQRSKAERLLEDRKETITDVYDKIVELEKQILENTLEEPLEITEINYRK